MKSTAFHKIVSLLFCTGCCLPVSTSMAGVVTFEDVGAALPPVGFYSGGTTPNDDGWSSGGVQFNNSVTESFGFLAWEGWAYSNIQDLLTHGFGNQYAVYSEGGVPAGFGAGNSPTYAIAFPGSVRNANQSVLSFAGDAVVNSVDIANTTYAVRAFRDGLDGGFGGAVQFQDGDFLRLDITGYDGINGTGATTGTISIDLANYGGPGLADDFYIRDWTQFDLTSLGLVRSLSFSLDSNVIDTFGGIDFLNPPAYVAMDNLNFSAVPEPSSAALLIVGLTLAHRRRRSAG